MRKSCSTNSALGRLIYSLRRRAVIALSIIVFGCFAASSRAGSTIPNTQFFDWEVPDTYPTAQSNIVPVPWLADSTAGGVNAFLASRPAGSTLAVKVLTPLTSQAALNIFKNYKINYVFADFESPTALQDTSNLIKQVQASKTSSKALIGEY